MSRACAKRRKNEEVVARLLDYGQQVEGLLRNASTHAAGVVIGDRPLDALVPLYQDPRSDMPATQFNMKWVEQAGLVKFDFLGLKTLTVIQNAVDQIKAAGGICTSRRMAPNCSPARGAVDDIRRSRWMMRRPTSFMPAPRRSRCFRWNPAA